MRIISKVRDYYDCGQAYGIDPELIYLRRPDEHVLLSGNQWIDRLESVRDTMPRAYRQPTVDSFIIGFCGKTYPGYRVTWLGKGKDGFSNMERILYHPDDFIDLFRFKSIRKAFPSFWDKPKRKKAKWTRCQMASTNIDAVFQSYEANFESEDFFELFLEINSPIWIYDPAYMGRFHHPRRKGTAIKINDTLKEYDFVRIQDPYTAYQELSMFVGGVLRRAEPIMASVSDASMLKKKGFHEYSFKTRPKGDKP